MKKILKYIFIGIIGVSLLSCEDEDTQRMPDTMPGANMRIQFKSAEQSFFNLLELQTAAIEYSIYSQNKNIDKVDIFLIFNDQSEGTLSEEVLFETWTQADFDANNGVISRRYTSDQMAQIVGFDDATGLDGGDFFFFRQETTLTDGRVYPSTTAIGTSNVDNNTTQATATASFTTTFFSFVGCPTEIVPGNYIASPTNPAVPCSNDPFGQAGILVSGKKVTVNQTGVVNFRFSDVSLGYYAGFGFQPNQPHDFLDVCNTLLNTAAAGQFNIGATGVHDPETGNISFSWTDFGNAGITCEVTYVPDF